VRLGVSRRSIFRDMALLTEAEVFFHYDRRKGYRVDLSRWIDGSQHHDPGRRAAHRSAFHPS
jgi:hypothetical protein